MVTFIENRFNGKFCSVKFEDWYLKRIFLQTLLSHKLFIFSVTGVIRPQQLLRLAFHLFHSFAFLQRFIFLFSIFPQFK